MAGDPNLSSDAAKHAAASLGDPTFASKLEGLSPGQIEAFVEMVRIAARKQRIMMWGYVAALIGLLGGLVLAFFLYAQATPGTFVGWVFLLPFSIAASILWIVGRITSSMKVRVIEDPEVAAAAARAADLRGARRD